MRLAVTVLILLCASARADAERISVPTYAEECACTDRIRPRLDETGVPTNARLWRLPSLERPDEPLGLEANTTYTLTTTSFTTDAVEDHVAPPAPHATQVWIDIGDGGDDRTRAPISSIGIKSDLDRDARIVRVTITDRFGSVVYYAAADHPSFCGAGLAILPGAARVSITAIDLAGNESPPDVVTVQPRIYQAARARPCARHVAEQGEWRMRDLVDHGVQDGHVDDVVMPPPHEAPLTLAVLAAGLVIPALVIFLGLAKRRRAFARMCASVEPFAISSVDDLAYAVRDRALLTLLVVAFVTALATRGFGFLITAVIGSPVLMWLAASSVMRLWASQRALHLIAFPDAVAEARYDQIDVIARGQHAVLRGSPRLVRRARARALPFASVDLQ